MWSGMGGKRPGGPGPFERDAPPVPLLEAHDRLGRFLSSSAGSLPGADPPAAGRMGGLSPSRTARPPPSTGRRSSIGRPLWSRSPPSWAFACPGSGTGRAGACVGAPRRVLGVVRAAGSVHDAILPGVRLCVVLEHGAPPGGGDHPVGGAWWRPRPDATGGG